MDKYLIRTGQDEVSPVDTPDHPSLNSSKVRRHVSRSKNMRSLLRDYEVRGTISPWHKRSLGRLMLMSYREVGGYEQFSGNLRTRFSLAQGLEDILMRTRNRSCSVSCIDFDSKGVYLAAVNNAKVLTIHEYESLHVKADSDDIPAAPEILATFADNILQAVRWNPANEDEVACVGLGRHNVAFYDVASKSFRPSQILRVNSAPDVVGLLDLRLCKNGSSRVLACGRDGIVHIWDRRASNQSNAALSVPRSLGSLNCVQLSSDEQVVFAGSDGGYVHVWDLRGGRRSATLVSCREVYHEPLGAVKLSAALSSLGSLTAQTRIESSAVHTIAVNPSCGDQMAFHLYNGWSGVVDMATAEITHLYGPPPFLYDEVRDSMASWPISGERPPPGPMSPRFLLRRPAWINSLFVFAVPSASLIEHSIHMLDFSSGPQSRHHVEHERTSECELEEQPQVNVPTSEEVISVAAHPLNDDLVAGTANGKLLLVSRRQRSSREHDSDASDEVI